MHAKRKSLTVLFTVAAILSQTILARAEPVERPTISAIILSVSPRTVRWATVHKAPDAGEDDPYYHVEVIEKERRAPPWQFKRLATHVVVTADALNGSRSRQKARTYFTRISNSGSPTRTGARSLSRRGRRAFAARRSSNALALPASPTNSAPPSKIRGCKYRRNAI
ncbi:UNVERIFIED_ORG: hypothetical protein GGD51_000866 [Rhizobium esperanzae]